MKVYAPAVATASWLGARLAAVGAAALVLSSCRQVPVDVAAPRPAAAAGGAQRELESGRALYVSADKCARCHSPKPVYEHGPQEWTDKVLPSMAKKAKLAPAEYADVLAYVTSPVAQTPPAPHR